MINIENVSFSYDTNEKDVLKNINLAISDGEFVLLTGISGSGKTSITKLINGLIPEFDKGNLRGNIFVNGQNTKEVYVSDLSHQVGSVFQDPNAQFFTTDTVSELVFPCENIGMEKEKIDRRLDLLSSQMELEELLDREIFGLSGGEKQRIAIASVCMYEPKVLVLDEPSANLDALSIEKLKNVLCKLKDDGYTIVISEHRIHYLMSLCDRMIYLKDGSIEKEYKGEDFRKLSNEQLHNMGLRGGDLKSLHNQIKNVKTSADSNLHIENLSFDYGNGKPVLDNLSLTFSSGDIVGIIGENGAGKSTLSEIVCGLRKEKSGSIYIKNEKSTLKQRQKKAYLVMQVPEYQLFTESVQAEVNLSKADENLCNMLLEKLELSDLLDRHPASLSGGQKQRLCIMLACIKDADIICFDEPTSGLDFKNMQNVAEVMEELSNQGKTILVVTHDYELIMRCCNKVALMSKNQVGKILDVDEQSKEKILKYMREKTVKKEEIKKMHPIKLLGQFIKPCLGKEILAVIFATISVLGSIIPYYATFQIFELFFAGNITEEKLFYWIIVAVIGFLIKILGHSISTCLAHISAYTILENIRLYVAKKLMNAPLGNVQKQNIGKLKNLVVDHVETLELPLAHLIPEGFAAFVLPVAVFVYMCTIDYRLALISLITIPLAVIPFFRGFKDYNTNYKNYMDANDKMNSAIVEYVEGVEVIKAFNQTTTSYEKFSKAISHFHKTTIDWFNTTYKTRSLMNVMLPTTTLGVLPLGLFLYITEGLEPSILLISILLSMGIVASLMKFSSFLNDLKAITFAVDSVAEIVDGEELIEGKKDNEVENTDIILENVKFSYNKDDEKLVLDDVNVKFETGKYYALVGPSGSGKSTIARLIARYWDVTDGAIKVGNIDIKDISLAKLSNLISFVTQDNYLFNTTIFENIKMGNANATDDQVFEAAEKAACGEFICKLENGYDSTSGEAGSKLSGGERQRIALARAILKNAPIVILDEATAYADPENEVKIGQSIAELTKGKTLIVIAHRLSTIKNADEILLINNGRIEQSGTHNELLQNSTLYKNMWEMHINAKNWSVTDRGEDNV